jgi:hypothetical protein
VLSYNALGKQNTYYDGMTIREIISALELLGKEIGSEAIGTIESDSSEDATLVFTNETNIGREELIESIRLSFENKNKEEQRLTNGMSC